jgi:hypothetical protein
VQLGPLLVAACGLVLVVKSLLRVERLHSNDINK